MCVPFLPVYLLELGAPKEDIEMWSALVFSSCFLIAGIMAPVWGKISDVKGKKSMALRASFLLCLCYTAGGLVTAPVQLLFIRILQGFANGYLPVVLSMVAQQSPRERLGTSMSIIHSSQLAGTVSGPLIGGLLADIYGYRSSFLIAGVYLAIVVIITWLTPEDKTSTQSARNNTSIIQDLKFCLTTPSISQILLLFFTFQMAMLATGPLMALYVAEMMGGYENAGLYAGIATSLPPMIGALIAPLWGMFGQRRGFFPALVITLSCSGIFVALQGVATTYSTLLIFSGFLGMFIVGILPSLNSALSVATTSDFKGRAFGAMTMAGQFGSMMGPIMAGVVSSYMTISHQFYVSGCILMLMAFMAGAMGLRQRREQTASAQAHAAERAVQAQRERESAAMDGSNTAAQPSPAVAAATAATAAAAGPACSIAPQSAHIAMSAPAADSHPPSETQADQ